MKTRRHHNNKGTLRVKRGKTAEQVKRIARKLKVPFVTKAVTFDGTADYLERGSSFEGAADGQGVMSMWAPPYKPRRRATTKKPPR